MLLTVDGGVCVCVLHGSVAQDDIQKINDEDFMDVWILQKFGR